MDQWAFFDEVKAGTVRNAYLFYGPEAYIRKSALATMQKKLLMPGLESMNCTFMQSPSAQQIIENCETLPMMGDWRLVVVQGLELLENGKVKDEAQESAALCAYLPRVPQTTCLIFECETPDKRKKLCQTLMKLPGAVSFDTLSDARLAQWMNQTLKPLGKKMDAQACAQLAFTSGRDLTMLHGELQKLAAYAGDRTAITQEDIERVATHTAECTVFAMVDALVDGQAQQAFSLEDKITPRTPPVFVWHTMEDETVPVENTLLLVSALHRAGVPCEAHLFEKGVHGTSLSTAEVNHPSAHRSRWLTLAREWLDDTFDFHLGTGETGG